LCSGKISSEDFLKEFIVQIRYSVSYNLKVFDEMQTMVIQGTNINFFTSLIQKKSCKSLKNANSAMNTSKVVATTETI
jgi:hypothetical protein